ncbi:MAG TPA: CehA/McbA family metallohydrolase [Planctomycetaceae bacterium]|nr:CehA/McbA family metallohydrolase [Planctomycetaceae bacterium]
MSKRFPTPTTPPVSSAARLILAALSVLALGATLWSQPADDRLCTVTLELFDKETNERQSGMIRIVDSEDRPVTATELLSRGAGLEGDLPIHAWFVVPRSGAVRIALPRKQLAVTAISGLDFEQTRLPLDLRHGKDQALRVPLQRFYRPASRGWRSANTHLHLMKLPRDQADRYLREVPAADGLDLLFVSYLERAGADHEYITNRYTSADLARLSEGSDVLYGNGEEHRHNFTAGGEGYGHVMLLNLQQLVQPVSIGPGIMRIGTDGLPVQRGIDAARRQGGTAVWCHNDWGLEHVPNWVLGRLDAQNIFDGGEHGSYRDSFYPLLNAGLRVPFSTGTDWFIYDFARVYVPVAESVTPAAWLKSLAAGRSYITNGPFLEFSVEGRTAGEKVALAVGGRLSIDARAVGRADFRSLELVVDGVVVQTIDSFPVEGHFEASTRWTIDMPRSGWLALRTPPPPLKGDAESAARFPQNEFGKPLFSHTSPVYVEVAGKAGFDPAAARELLARVERSRRQVAESARFADDVERAGVLQVYHEAIGELQRRLGETQNR